MENITVYKTKAAMTIEGYIQGKEGEKVFRRQTVPLTTSLDEAVITFDFPERSVQPSVKIAEKTVTVDGEDVVIGMFQIDVRKLIITLIDNNFGAIHNKL